MNRYVMSTIALTALATIAQGAQAQGPADDGNGFRNWYWGIGVSVNQAGIPDGTASRANSAVAGASGAASYVADKDDRSSAMKLLLGYRLSRYFAVEGGYANLGETSMSTDFRSGGVPSTSVGTFNMKYKMSAPFIDAVAILPFGNYLSLFGHVGVSYTETKADISGSPLTLILANSEKSESKAFEKFGAGIEYNVIPEFSIRAEWERYKAPDPLSDENIDIDAATLSFLYRF